MGAACNARMEAATRKLASVELVRKIGGANIAPESVSTQVELPCNARMVDVIPKRAHVRAVAKWAGRTLIVPVSLVGNRIGSQDRTRST